jgi:hypothetical protein
MSRDVVEAAKKIAEKMSSEQKSFGGYDYLTLQEGPNVIRLLPPPPGLVEFWVRAEASFNVGPNKRMVIPGRQFGQPDPLSDYLDKLYASQNPDDKATANRMWPKARFFMWAINRSDAELKPKLFNTNGTVFAMITGIFADPEYDDITDPQSGTDLNIIYTPKEKTKNGWPDWQVLPKRKSSPLGTEEQIKSWTATNLFEKYKIGKPYDAEYVQKILDGKDFEKTEEEKKKEDEAYFGKNGKGQTTPLTESFWVCHPVSGQVVQLTDVEVVDLLEAGHESFMMMALADTDNWKDVKEFFDDSSKKEAPKPVPPPAPKAPSRPMGPSAGTAASQALETTRAKAPTAPPAESSMPADDDEAKLKAQLDALKAKRAQGGGASASEALQKALEE